MDDNNKARAAGERELEIAKIRESAFLAGYWYGKSKKTAQDALNHWRADYGYPSPEDLANG